MVETVLSSIALIVSLLVLAYVAREARRALKAKVLDLLFSRDEDMEEVEQEEEPFKPLIVVAPHYQQACYFVSSIGISPRNQRAWVYAADPSRLYGYRGNRCVFYGDWQDRKDAVELWDIARTQGFEIQEVQTV